MPNFRLYVHRGPEVGRDYELYGSMVTIGRDIPNHIVINDSELSRYHCRLIWNGDGYQVEDLGSDHGTFINGRLVSGIQPLQHGDAVGLGEGILCSYYDRDISAKPPTMPLSNGPRYRLILRHGTDRDRMYALHGSVVNIGRDLSNDIVINDPELSRQHCRLIWDGDGYSVEDLGSTNGTFLNGQRISQKISLNNGDMFYLGQGVGLQYGTGDTSELPPIDVEQEREALAKHFEETSAITNHGTRKMPQIALFISYSHLDSEFAFRLAGDLRALNYQVWIDFGAVNGGQIWADEIEGALRQCHAVIVVVSPEAMQSTWVRKEVTMAVHLEKNVVPVLLHEAEFPLSLVDIQYVDFRGDYGSALRQLCEIL